MGKVRTSNNHRGATLVEAAIAIPILLGGIFFFIFLGLALNARSSLSASVGMAARLALTRGNPDSLGSEQPLLVIQDVYDWHNTGAMSQRLKDMLATPNEASAAFGASGHYDTMARQTFGVSQFRLLPPSYIFSQIYALQNMKQSVGEVRYPCDPNSEYGCLQCWNLHATTSTRQPPASCTNLDCYGQPNYNYDYVGIECSYSLGASLLLPLRALIDLLSGGGNRDPLVITRSQFYERY